MTGVVFNNAGGPKERTPFTGSFAASGMNLLPAFKDNNIPVFFTCDDKFLPHAMTAIASIMEHGSRENNYDIIVIGEGLEEGKRVRAIEWMGQYPNGTLRFLDAAACLNLSEMASFYVTKAYPLAVYFRLFAPTLLANYDKIVYLDSDIVVLDDIAELYRHDTDRVLLAAVHDLLAEEGLNSVVEPGRSQPGEHIGFQAGDSYFNSGVMLLNLKKMREEGVQEKLIEVIQTIKTPALPDQDILNHVCKGRVSFIDVIWNFPDWMAEAENASVRAHFASPSIRDVCRRAGENYKILHYMEGKPWSSRYTGTQGGHYWRYLKATPFFPLVEDELRRKTSLTAKLPRFAYLSFHLLRCGVPYPFASSAKKERLRRRMFSYWLQMKSLFLPAAWRRVEALENTFPKERALPASKMEKATPPRTGESTGNQIIESTNAVPRISVLMPAYNAEKFVAEAIESILAQTFADFEFIIINDGSEDKTAEIIQAYDDPRIVFIDHEENRGLVAVLNQGMDMARGEYIARMDADDIAYLERFAKQVAFMDANPDVGMASSNARIFGDKFGAPGDRRNETSRNPAFLGALDWYRGCKALHPTAMLRKAAFDWHNLRYDPDYVACEDYELWSRAARYMKIANIQDVLLDYRWHGGNVTARQRGIQMKNTRRVQGNILDFCMHDEKDRLSYRFFAGENEVPLYAWVRLFGFIPFLKIKAQRNSRKFFLFNFIPLMKIRNGWTFLFFVLPVAKMEIAELGKNCI